MIRRSRAAGFTLLEMMIVVILIGVVVGLAAPAIHASLVEKRMNEAGLELVRGLRRARSEAMGYGRASLVRFDTTLNDGRGGYTFYRGISNSCNANDWPAITAGVCTANPFCREVYDPERNLGANDTRVVLQSGQQLLDLCFEPNGVLLFRVGVAGRFSDQNTTNGGFVFNIDQIDGQSVTRRVLLPLGASARVLR